MTGASVPRSFGWRIHRSEASHPFAVSVEISNDLSHADAPPRLAELCRRKTRPLSIHSCFDHLCVQAATAADGDGATDTTTSAEADAAPMDPDAAASDDVEPTNAAREFLLDLELPTTYEPKVVAALIDTAGFTTVDQILRLSYEELRDMLKKRYADSVSSIPSSACVAVSSRFCARADPVVGQVHGEERVRGGASEGAAGMSRSLESRKSMALRVTLAFLRSGVTKLQAAAARAQQLCSGFCSSNVPTCAHREPSSPRAPSLVDRRL